MNFDIYSHHTTLRTATACAALPQAALGDMGLELERSYLEEEGEGEGEGEGDGGGG